MSDLQTSVVVSLVNKVSAPLRKMLGDMKTTVGNVDRLNEAIARNQQRRAALRGQLFDAVALGTSLAAPIKAAIDFESAMADVRKVVDFGAPDGLEKMSEAIKDMSRSIPISAAGLAQIVAAGGQLGVKEQDLRKFAEVAAKMSVAFDISANEAGDAMAKLSNVFSIPISEAELLGDAINHLSDNTAAKASEMVQALLRVGGTAKAFGLAAPQVGALASAFISLGKSPEVAGTAINALLQKLNTASIQGDDFKRALRAIGLSAKDMEAAIGKDAQGALIDFLERLSKLSRANQARAAGMMFGQEYSDDIALLVGSLDAYKASLGLVASRTQFAGSMTREFQNRSQTTSNALKLLANGVNELGINLGSVLLPGLNTIVSGLRTATGVTADLAAHFPVATKVISTFVALLIGAKIAAIAGAFAFTFMQGGLLTLTKGIHIAVAAVRLLTVAMAANPVGALVAAITTAAALIIMNWDKVTAIFRDFDPLGWVREKIESLTGYLSGLNLASLGKNLLGSLWSGPTAGGAASPSPSYGSPSATVGGSAASMTAVDIGGTLNIKIDSEGRARVESITKYDRFAPFEIDVDAGLAMSMP